MPAAIIQYTLDLVLRLVDTTSGSLVAAQNLAAESGGKPLSFTHTEDGQLLFVNIGREDFSLTVRAKGYEEKIIDVRFGDLDKNPPALEIQMIPDESYRRNFQLKTISGTLRGITEVDAVKLGTHSCFAVEQDTRKRLLTISNPYKLSLENVYYAALATDETSFEPFTVKKQNSDTVLKLEKALQKPFDHAPVVRRVFGRLRGDDYLLRVRDDYSDARWLLRTVSPAGERFEALDLGTPREDSS
jgi:hypothetical protein